MLVLFSKSCRGHSCPRENTMFSGNLELGVHLLCALEVNNKQDCYPIILEHGLFISDCFSVVIRIQF